MKKDFGKIVVISGPTGSGESTITKRVLELFPGMKRIVTATSRPPRPTEKDGVDYHFFSPDEFERRVKAGEFLEYIQVPNRHVWYGTLRKPIEEKLNAGIHLIGNLGWPGHASFAAAYPGRVFSVFLQPDDLSVIRSRIMKRDPTITSAEVEKRLKHAAKEMEDGKYYDRIIVNKDGKIDETVAEVRTAIDQFLRA